MAMDRFDAGALVTGGIAGLYSAHQIIKWHEGVKAAIEREAQQLKTGVVNETLDAAGKALAPSNFEDFCGRGGVNTTKLEPLRNVLAHGPADIMPEATTQNGLRNAVGRLKLNAGHVRLACVSVFALAGFGLMQLVKNILTSDQKTSVPK